MFTKSLWGKILDGMVRYGLKHPRVRKLVARGHNLLACNCVRLRGGSLVQAAGAFLHHCKWDVEGPGNVVTIGSGAQLSGLKIFVRGCRNQIQIGAECFFKSGSLWIEGEGCAIRIGPETTVEEAHLAASEGTAVEIGNDCMLAFGIDIRSGDSHAILDKTTGVRLNPAQNIFLKDHVWVAANVQILKGVTIGAGSVIGTRSVVTHSVPANAIACGVPARVVRTGVTWTRSIEQPAGIQDFTTNLH